MRWVMASIWAAGAADRVSKALHFDWLDRLHIAVAVAVVLWCLMWPAKQPKDKAAA